MSTILLHSCIYEKVVGKALTRTRRKLYSEIENIKGGIDIDYVISDMHFDDSFLMQVQDEDFDTVQDKNELIVANWNKKIHDNNTKVYILGDVGFSKEVLQDIIPRLRGYLILIG